MMQSVGHRAPDVGEPRHARSASSKVAQRPCAGPSHPHPKEPRARLVGGVDIAYDKVLSRGIRDIHPMRLIGSLIEHLQRWFARYRTELAQAEASNEQRPSLTEIEWNGAMIGDLRRRSLDA
jgi:hypothetical protein